MQGMKPYSTKRGKQVREYNKLRIEYLIENPDCKKCGEPAGTIHHKKGRMGEMLLNTKYWMSACMDCHVWIEDNPEEAKKLGYSLNRLS